MITDDMSNYDEEGLYNVYSPESKPICPNLLDYMTYYVLHTNFV